MKYGRAALVTVGLSGVLLFTSNARAAEHKIENVSEAKWGAAPPMLPPGAKIEVLAGSPMGDGLYTVRLKFPANYKIPAHSHPKDELVTVLSGTLYMGMGDKLDPKAGKTLTVGGFGLMPANENHFAFTKKETIILLHGMGPVEFKYVNPADDPRNKS
jgi:quercetin dioxygenase-like cupin family protein